MDKTFHMKKDDRAQLPPDAKAVIIGLGWDCEGSIDLDASIVPLDANKNEHDIVYFGNQTGKGIQHSGDNTTGDGDGDDELIRIDFDQVDSKSVELYVVVNIYTSWAKFSDVSNAYMRICVKDPNKGQFSPGHELARYTLDRNI